MARLISTFKRWKGKTVFWLRGKKLWMRLPAKRKRHQRTPANPRWKDFRAALNPTHFAFRHATSFEYGDPPSMQGHTVNELIPTRMYMPHLVLADERGVNRFALAFTNVRGGIEIRQLQRLRTQYDSISHGQFRWNAKKETAASKELKKKLNGMHPGELLLSQFIAQHSASIVKGVPIRWPMGKSMPIRWTGKKDFSLHEKRYSYFLSHFFKPVAWVEKYPKGERIYELDIMKPKVRNILGLP